MREKKWVLNIYQPDDEAAIVKRLEKLATKGWFLERADNWGWSPEGVYSDTTLNSGMTIPPTCGTTLRARPLSDTVYRQLPPGVNT